MNAAAMQYERGEPALLSRPGPCIGVRFRRAGLGQEPVHRASLEATADAPDGKPLLTFRVVKQATVGQDVITEDRSVSLSRRAR
jgi:hypothetical protein